MALKEAEVRSWRGSDSASEITDLRSWMQLLEKEGELRRIKAEVNPAEELGTIVRKVMAAQGPALLFENIKGYQKNPLGRKVVSGSLAKYRRIATLLGLSPETTNKEMIKACRDGFKKRLAPVQVGGGPVKENIMRGRDIDLDALPVPKWHKWDGGRYINTSCSVVTKDPESGITNVGTYRGMIVPNERNLISCLLIAAQHWGIHYSKYKISRYPMPVAVVIGFDPILRFCAGTPLPAGTDEYEVASAMRGRPIELVKCETSDLLVPAHAEYVLEGIVSIDQKDLRLEGPFGEYTGYYGGAASLKPTIRVECITHRNDPIFEGSLEGFRPGWPNETGTFASIAFSAMAWNILETAGVPGVTDVFTSHLNFAASIAVQLHKTYRGQAKQVAAALWASNAAQWMFKNVTVVEEDIDIHNPEEMEWAYAWRVNAEVGDIEFRPGCHGAPLDPSTRLEERDITKFGSGKWCRVLVDATRNWSFQRWEQWNYSVYPPIQVLENDIDEATKKRWDEYGLSDITYKPVMAIDRDDWLKEYYSLRARPTPEEVTEH